MVNVKDFFENAMVVNLKKDTEYYHMQELIIDELQAVELQYESIIKDEKELKMVKFLEKLGYEILTSELEYSTCVCNNISYKALCIEKYLLTDEKSLERAYSIAHEIGHVIDCKNNFENEVEFQDYYEKHMNSMETVAWAYATKLLKILGYDVKTDEYIELMIECLTSYFGNAEQVIYALKNINKIVEMHEKKLSIF